MPYGPPLTTTKCCVRRGEFDTLWHTIMAYYYGTLLWHTIIAYYGILLWQTMAYCGTLLWHTMAYYGILWHTISSVI